MRYFGCSINRLNRSIDDSKQYSEFVEEASREAWREK
jgi:hypothetical protein